jgi:hypothetical protein
MRYEAIPKKKIGTDRPPDYEIRPVGAGRGTGKICTVHGYYGVDTESIAKRIVDALTEYNVINGRDINIS